MRGTEQQKRGYQKVKNFCKHANHQYVWVDTCCIDKSSSAELSEAINSMFNWYRDAEVCFVFLNIKTAGPKISTDELRNARWCSRGWCLQELIAPSQVKFFNRDWALCGDRQGLAEKLYKVTNIDPELLYRAPGDQLGQHFSIAKRMSWAANRVTTRPEDTAYCLLGIFDVHMPLLYGEGGQRAFLRLQEEILKRSVDHSILAWGNMTGSRYRGPLATSPAEFSNGATIVTVNSNSAPFETTNKGLRVHLPLIDIENGKGNVIAILHNCRYEDNFMGPLGVVLKPLESNNVYCRAIDKLQVVDLGLSGKTDSRTIYITPQLLYQRSIGRPKPLAIWFNRDTYRQTLPWPLDRNIRIEGPPTGHWNSSSYVLRREDGCGLFNAPGYATLYYRGETIRSDKSLLEILVSPVGLKGAPQVGLREVLDSISKSQDLPNTMTVLAGGYSIKVTALVEKKAIMDEGLLEVSLLMQCSKV